MFFRCYFIDAKQLIVPKSFVLTLFLSSLEGWSSAREPSQVFTLLECIYGSFDRIANRLGVFKVETVGYVNRSRAINKFSETFADTFALIVEIAMSQLQVSVAQIVRKLLWFAFVCMASQFVLR